MLPRIQGKNTRNPTHPKNLNSPTLAFRKQELKESDQNPKAEDCNNSPKKKVKPHRPTINTVRNKPLLWSPAQKEEPRRRDYFPSKAPMSFSVFASRR